MAPIMVTMDRAVRSPVVMVARMDAKDCVRPAYSATNSAANDSAKGTGDPASMRCAVLHAGDDTLGVGHDRRREQSRERSIFEHLEHVCLRVWARTTLSH